MDDIFNTSEVAFIKKKWTDVSQLISIATKQVC